MMFFLLQIQIIWKFYQVNGDKIKQQQFINNKKYEWIYFYLYIFHAIYFPKWIGLKKNM